MRPPRVVLRGCPYCSSPVRVEHPQEGLEAFCEECGHASVYKSGELEQPPPATDDTEDYSGREYHDGS